MTQQCNLFGAALKTHFQQLLSGCPLVAILRGISPDEVETVCGILADSTVGLLEIPLNTPLALECIAIAAKCCSSRQLVGAGTVLEESQVHRVAAAGGRFVISPNTDPRVIRATKQQQLLSIPGCFTVSEAFAAGQAGADWLKLFPAGRLGAGYIRDLQAVVSLPFLAVGGINAANLREFLTCCDGVGIGGALYRRGKSMDEFRRDVETLVHAVRFQ